MCRNQKLAVVTMLQHAMKHAMTCENEEFCSTNNAMAWNGGCCNMRQNNKRSPVREENVAAYTTLYRGMRTPKKAMLGHEGKYVTTYKQKFEQCCIMKESMQNHASKRLRVKIEYVGAY